MQKILFLLLTMTALFGEVTVGERFPPLTLHNQFEQNISLDNTTQLLMVSFQKGVSSEIQEFLERKEEGFLTQTHTLYMVDVSGLPSFILTLFALPKMKKFNFNVALIDQEELAKRIPKEEDKVTLIKLYQQQILSIKFVKPSALQNYF